MDTKERRIYLMLQGAIAVYEEVSPEIMALLQNYLAEAFDLIGNSLHWMNQEIKKP